MPEPSTVILVLVVLHVPPVVASVNATVAPVHTEAAPVMVDGSGLTVRIPVTEQPETPYMSVVVPAITPETIPEVLPTVAIAALPVVQVPPLTSSLIIAVPPRQTVSVPFIVGGAAFTFTTTVVLQPEPTEYVIVAVPALIPVTTPEVEPTLAAASVVLHIPPVGISLRVVVPPIQTEVLPIIADGSATTVKREFA